MKKVIYSPEISGNRKIIAHASIPSSMPSNMPSNTSSDEFMNANQALEYGFDTSNSDLTTDVPAIGAGDYQSAQNTITELQQELHVLNERYISLEEKHKAVLDDIEQQRAFAQQKGYDEGVSEAESEIKTAIDSRFSACEEFIKELKAKAFQEIFHQEEVCLEIIYSAVCRLVGESAGTKEQIRNILKQTMEKVAGQDNLDVYVSPSDYQHLIDDELIAKNLFKLEELEYGGCLLKTGKGKVEAKLDQQLDQLKTLLLSVHGRNSG